MIQSEKVTIVSTLSGEEDVDTVSAYLWMAGKKILRRAYPFDDSVSEVPEKYEHLQIDAAVYLLNKRGAEGEQSHSENGISRTYESADLPQTMLNEISPVCGVAS